MSPYAPRKTLADEIDLVMLAHGECDGAGICVCGEDTHPMSLVGASTRYSREAFRRHRAEKIAAAVEEMLACRDT